MSISNPCFKCAMRTPYCHDNCSKYIAYKNMLERNRKTKHNIFYGQPPHRKGDD